MRIRLQYIVSVPVEQFAKYLRPHGNAGSSLAATNMCHALVLPTPLYSKHAISTTRLIWLRRGKPPIATRCCAPRTGQPPSSRSLLPSTFEHTNVGGRAPDDYRNQRNATSGPYQWMCLPTNKNCLLREGGSIRQRASSQRYLSRRYYLVSRRQLHVLRLRPETAGGWLAISQTNASNPDRTIHHYSKQPSRTRQLTALHATP